MIDIEVLNKAYESDVNDIRGSGRFEILNMLTNRDVLEEHRKAMTTLQSARLLFADENLMANNEQVISECGGKSEFKKIRQHNP